MTLETPKHQNDIWAHQAMESLRHDELDPLPENFAVFFHYHSGKNPNLTMAIDLLRNKFGLLSQQHCSELYRTYLGLEAEHRVLQETNAAIESEINRMIGMLDKNNADAATYKESLTTFSGTLQTAGSLDSIRTALAKVATETRSMVEQNSRLQAQLAQSTEQLTEVRFNLDQVRRDSLTDPLTEIGNRKFFQNALLRATEHAAEAGTPLTMLMIDIDHFKKFNDTYGHLIGDQVLRLVARTLVENLKGRDIVARYGGEEFVILLQQTRVNDAEKVANQLRTVLATKQIQRKKTGEKLGTVTISLGATEYYAGEDMDGFIARADAALYEAKQTGRNKAVVRTLTAEEIEQLPRQQADAVPTQIETSNASLDEDFLV